MAGVSPAVTGPEAAQGIPDYLLKYDIPFLYTAIPGNSHPQVCRPWQCLLHEQVSGSLPSRGLQDARCDTRLSDAPGTEALDVP